MTTTLLIDYLTFSIKPVSKDCDFGLDFVFRFLCLDRSDFFDIGSRMHYAHCYSSSSGIHVYEACADRINDMGCCISMSGTGCRYFESNLKDGEFVKTSDVWQEFFKKLRLLNDEGYSVNVSRIDIACDDKSYDDQYLLDLELIRRSANSREFVSQFRQMYDFVSKDIMTGQGKGTTLYFGSRKSSTLCRFYDKLTERRMRCVNDADQLKELEGITHWVRMEFEFKREQAVKIVNAICDSDDFAKYYAKVVNGYIRFIDIDNDNTSRCTLKDWWLRFIGTCERASLSVGEYKGYGYNKMLNYFNKYLSTTVFTLLSRMSPAEFFDNVHQSAVCRLKSKHIKIMGGLERSCEFSASEWWDLLNPSKRGVVSASVNA